MKTNYIQTIGILFSIIFLYGCYDEKDIISSGYEVVARYEFPQGNTPADQVFEQIYQEYGTMIIYTNFDGTDLERSWTNSNLSGGNSILDYQMTTNPDTLLQIANFYKTRFFDFLNPELAKKQATIKPEYIYITLNARQFYESLNWVTWQPCYLAMYQPFGVMVNQGMDSWFTGFVPEFYFDEIWYAPTGEILPHEDEMWEVTYDDPEFHPLAAYKMNINLFYLWYTMAADAGVIKVPDNFQVDVDTDTAFYDYNEKDPNYCTIRGFAEINNVSLSTSTLLTSVSLISDLNARSRVNTPERDFAAFIVNALLIGDYYEEHYAGEEYTLLRSRYKRVLDYMKSEYDIDLAEQAKKLRSFYPFAFE